MDPLSALWHTPAMLSIRPFFLAAPRQLPLALALGLSVLAGPTRQSLADASADASGIAAPPAKARPAPGLPHTDGVGLLPRPDPLPREVAMGLFKEAQGACDGPCVTPFGQVLGSADGVEARSNCVSTCLRLEYAFLDPASGAVSVHGDTDQPGLRYLGITHQCVAYARHWWARQLGLTFGDVGGAHEILYLTEGRDLDTQQPVALARSLNGGARRPPRRGDLLVYYPEPDEPRWRHGHVAVVVGVDLDQGWVALAEENYDNRPWVEPQAFARRIRLFAVGGRFTLVDVDPTSLRNAAGGRIAGWLYPLREP